MEKIITAISLDFVQNRSLTTVNVKQYDNLRQIKISLFNNGNSVAVSAETDTAEINASIGKIITAATQVCEIKDNCVLVSITDSMTAFAGDERCEIRITNSKGKVSTATFNIKVEPSTVQLDMSQLVKTADIVKKVDTLSQKIDDVLAGSIPTHIVNKFGEDLNNYKNNGFYFFGGANIPSSHLPIVGSEDKTGYLLVIGAGYSYAADIDHVTQIWITAKKSITGTDCFVRNYEYSSSSSETGRWSPWRNLLNDFDMISINCGGTGATNARQAYQNLAVVDVAEAIDLNNVTDTGIYSLQNMSAITNAPDGVALGCVYVAKLPIDGTSGARFEQILIGGTNNVSKHKVYIRHGQGDDTGTTWANWRLIYNSGLDTSGTLTLSSAVGADGRYQTMADKVVEVTIGGTFAPTAAGKTTITTLPFGFIKAQSFICHDMTHNTPLEATLSKTGELSIDFKSTGQQRLALHETFICK